MLVCRIRFNTSYSYYDEQCVLNKTRSCDYKKYTDAVLKEIMIQMDIISFVDDTVMIELLYKVTRQEVY